MTINRNKNLSIRTRTLANAAILMLFVSSIAAGIIKSANGVLLFSILAVIQFYGDKIETKNKYETLNK